MQLCRGDYLSALLPQGAVASDGAVFGERGNGQAVRWGLGRGQNHWSDRNDDLCMHFCEPSGCQATVRFVCGLDFSMH